MTTQPNSPIIQADQLAAQVPSAFILARHVLHQDFDPAVIRKAHDQGQRPRRDHVPPENDARWCRTGTDCSARSPDVLKPR